MTLLSFSIAFLFSGYEFIRVSSESLFINVFGADKLPYAMTVVPFAVAFLIYAYGRVLSKTGGLKAMLYSFGFSIGVFLLTYLNIKGGSKAAVAFLYIFKESYIVIVVEQYWSFINSTLKSSEAKAFNGPITGIGCLGPIVAGYLMNRLAVSFGTEQFILVSAVNFLPVGVLAWAAYKLAGEPQPSEEEKGGKLGHLHLRLLVENRTVMLIALFIGLTQVLSTVLNLRMYQLLETTIPGKDVITAYMGGFWSRVNSFAFLMQFVATPLLLRFIPVRYVLVAIPAVHVITCLILLSYPVLPVAAGAYLLFKGLDYSVFRASKEILYIPLSYDARYRAKQVADAFMNRFTKGVTAGSLSAVKASFNAIPGFLYGLTGFFSALAWTGLAAYLAAQYRESDSPKTEEAG